ncbi:TetR/AcrR family transcriptional regulator [Paenibacillus paeoniae]|uniref:TetR/AcrR family transcriptional regulator n=1 Tax=Paenibacillus paeoniae TaxID=2292705 RepID=A0A371PHF3_9BACL|nr:TetR/AcrR family transcriptional regulator [Paenibacillus paeoniae]REK75641.1 TetR/AcrR family transcriptional regulator [Paenibacillus paeoniae]
MSVQSEQLQQFFKQSFEETSREHGVRQIMLHAVDVFSRKGFAGTKIKDIAEHAGFSQGYVYNYFKSKDEIFTRIVEQAMDGAGKAVAFASQLEGTPMQRITWLTEAFLEPNSIAMQHWRLNLLQTAAVDAIPEEAKRIAREKMGEPFKHFVPMVIEGQRLGEIVEGDPLMLAITYFSFVQGLGISRIQTKGDLPFPDANIVLAFLRKPVN